MFYETPDNFEIVAGVLLAATFACAGLLGLWAGACRAHWFVRCAVVALVLAPIALIPAHEPFFLLLAQVAVVAGALASYRRRVSAQSAGQPLEGLTARRRPLRFSTRSFLLVMVLISLSLPVLVKVDGEVFANLPFIAALGAALGATTLLASGATAIRVHAWSRLICFLVSCALSAGVIALAGSLLFHYLEPSYSTDGSLALYGVLHTFLLCALLIVLRICGAAMTVGCVPPDHAPRSSLSAWMSQCCATALLVLVATPPSWAVWRMLHPPARPQVAVPTPNGWDDLLAAGDMFNSPILDMTVQPASTAELVAEVAAYGQAYDRLRLGLSRGIANPIWNTEKAADHSIGVALDSLQKFRNIARAVAMETECARREGKFREAATMAMENIEFGDAVGRGGVNVDFLVGAAIEGVGRSDLFRLRNELPRSTCRELMGRLSRMDSQKESIDALLHRDQIETICAYGWTAHLDQILWEAAGEQSWLDVSLRELAARQAAELRLLVVELALRCYYLDHGEYPVALEELVPDLLAALPHDPFAAPGSPLIYLRQDDGYVLYSVGQNRRDDGGAAPTDNSDLINGDLRLDMRYSE